MQRPGSSRVAWAEQDEHRTLQAATTLSEDAGGTSRASELLQGMAARRAQHAQQREARTPGSWGLGGWHEGLKHVTAFPGGVSMWVQTKHARKCTNKEGYDAGPCR